MRKPQLFCALMACIALTSALLSFGQVKVPFSFTLNSAASTSAGVYTKNGVLVRTLWSSIAYQAGLHTQTWDGTNDSGILLSNNSYEVRVLSNNVKYSWEGVIGNTSAALSGPSVHHAFQNIYNIAFAGNNAYFTLNYNEQLPAIAMFTTSNPQVKTSLLTKGACTAFVTTDNNYVYWDGQDANDTARTFVYVTKVKDNSEVTNFSSGISIPIIYGRTYCSSIDVNYNVKSKITGLAVQKTGNFLFVAHQKMNRIDVINKSTGNLIRYISITTPSGLATDGSNNLWVISGSNAAKYIVNSDGTLTATKLVLTGLVAPLALAVSTDGNTIVVADGATSQQLKAYNNSTGAAAWTYGKAGGYATDPTVSTDKFFFADREGVRTFISFASDGSFWVGDPGNSRTLHFSASRTYIDNIMFLPHSYSSVVDPNNTNRVFSDFLEFKVDYSKNLSPSNGSWTLVKNWGYGVTAAYNDDYYRLRGLTTLSNGRTYAFLRHVNNLALVELPSSGKMRYTGVEITNLNAQLQADGSLLTVSEYISGKPLTWKKQILAGFDGSNNPIWNSAVIIATSPAATDADPLFHGSGNAVITSSNMLVSFDAGLPPYGSSGYHLGAITIGDNKWLWRTAKNTSADYTGDYPADGAYDIGNGVQYAGSYARALDRSIIWGYHGEFWKNSQVNKWNQVYDDGLFIGQFGVTGLDNTIEAAPMMSGNAFAVSLVKDSSGNGYVYLNDESVHGGVHRWKITGLNTLAEQKIPVTLTATGHGLLATYFDGTDLDNLKLRITRIDTVVNLTASNIPATHLLNTTNFSARWVGSITPTYSENYTLYTTSTSGIRLWINDSLLINKWNNSSLTEYSTRFSLIKGQQYTIKIEYYNSNSVANKLLWSSPSQTKQIVPAAYLTPIKKSDTTGGIDLMEGLSFKKVMGNNMYGWKRDPVIEDYSDIYSKWWSATSGFNSYNKLKSPDVYAKFAQNKGTYNITRNLGINKDVQSWKLTGFINFNGNAENESTGKGAMYLDVLDNAGKIIFRFYVTTLYNPIDPILTIHANNSIVAQAGRSIIEPIMYTAQPIEINATAKGILTLSYGPYTKVSTSVFDVSSNWQNPQTFRLYFLGNSDNNYGRIIDLQSLRFSTKGNQSKTSPVDSILTTSASGNDSLSTPATSTTDTLTGPGIDLMENLPFKSILANNMYGWNKNPETEIYTNAYTNYWCATSGYNSSSLLKSPDVLARYVQNNGTATITRDLGTNMDVYSWKLSGIVNYNGNTGNDPTGRGGMYMEVLDNSGKIITRFYTNTVWNAIDPTVSIYANNVILTQGGLSKIQLIQFTSQPIEIKADNGGIYFTYGPFASVKAPIYDAASNWKTPQTLRLYFYGNGANYPRVINLISMKFVTTVNNNSASIIATTKSKIVVFKNDETTTTTDSQLVLVLYPNPVRDHLQVNYPLVNNTATIEIMSAEGKKLKLFPLSLGSSSKIIDVSSLPQGIYFLSYHKDNSKLIIKQFIK